MKKLNLTQYFRKRLANKYITSLDCYFISYCLCILLFIIAGIGSKVLVPVNADLELNYMIGRDSIVIYNGSDQYVSIADITLTLYDDNGREEVIKEEIRDIYSYKTKLVQVSNSSIPSGFKATSFVLELNSQRVTKFPSNCISLCIVVGILVVFSFIIGLKKEKNEKQKRLETRKATESMVKKIKLKG